MANQPQTTPLIQLRKLWAKTPPNRQRLGLAGLTIVMVCALYFGLRSSGLTYDVLYSNLTPEDASEIIAKLDELHVPYRIASGGTAIEVPYGDVHRVRIAAASSGLPRGGGVGFEIFDDQQFGTSRFVEQLNYRRALQGELSRTVAALDVVNRARVHIAMGEQSIFQEEAPLPSASVAVRLYRGRKLSRPQVVAIRNLVASSVDRLAPEQVVVVDETGKLLSIDAGDESQTEAGEKFERGLELRVRQLLERVTGKGAVEVSISAKFDRQRVDLTEEIYDPERTVVRSESRTVEGETKQPAPASGVAGARGNLAGIAKSQTTLKGAGHISETRNYELTKILRRTTGPVQKLVRLQIAVLVDVNKDENGEAVARSEEELKELEALAAQAAGLDADRGDTLEVRSIAFAPLPPPEEAPVEPQFPIPLPLIMAGGGLLFFLIVVVIFLVRKKKNPREQVVLLPAPISELEAALDDRKQLQQINSETNQLNKELSDRLHGIVSQDSERAARVLTNWVVEDNQNKRVAN